MKSAKNEEVRLLQVVSRLNIGGPALQVLLVESLLSKQPGYNCRLITGRVGRREGDMSYLAQELGVTPLYLSDLSREVRLLSDVRNFFKLLLHIRQFQPDIVHTHASKAGALGRLAALVYNLGRRFGGATPSKTVHTFHGHVLSGYFGRGATLFFRVIERWLARFTDCIVVLCEAQKEELHGQYHIGRAEQYRVIPIGLNLSPFLAPESGTCLRKEIGVSSDTLAVGIVGRLTAVKNHPMFLEAMRCVKDRRKEAFRALVVGDGEVRVKLERLASQLDIQNEVIFMGWRSDMPEVYSALDIVCLTSINEGTPLSLIEALAAGRPVVATNVGGVSDIVKSGENGYLVPVDAEGEFCDRVIELIKEPEKRKKFGQAGRDHVVHKYSVERLIADLDNLYKELLSS